MAVFNFTVRATDSEGSYADRQFNITVRNSRVERYMVIDTTNAYTSPDGTTWTQRAGSGGYTCAYGNGFWLVMKATNTMDLLKSTDGINYTLISTASMTFVDEAGATLSAPTSITSFPNAMKLKFWNGRFYIIHLSNVSGQRGYDLWSTADGINWKRKRLSQLSTATQISLSSQAPRFNWAEDNGTLIIPFAYDGSAAGLNTGYLPTYGWTTTDGETFTRIYNTSNTASASVAGAVALTRFNGLYIATHCCYNNSSYAGQFNTSDRSSYMYSTDGVNWTLGSYNLRASDNGANTNVANWAYYSSNNPIYVNGQLYMLPYKVSSAGMNVGEALLTSLDGNAWTLSGLKAFNAENTSRTQAMIYKNGIFLIASSNSSGNNTTSDNTLSNNGFRISTDGSTWSSVNIIGTGTINYNDVAAM